MDDLVILRNNQVICDSLQVAKRFNKKHKTVLRSIDNLVAQNCATKEMFHERDYKANDNQIHRMYFMTRDGFSLLAMGFTGKQALEWKIKYIQAFNKMEQLLLEKQTQQWIETRYQGKLTRKSETDMIQQLVEYAQKQGSEHAEKLYIVYSKLANKIAGVHTRDTASTLQLNNLLTIENIILHVIEEGIKANKGYKQIYQDCKERLVVFQSIAYLVG